MKSKICLFAGTTEGHALARFLGGQDVSVTISVATEYGAQVIEPFENEKILYGKMPEDDIRALLEKERFDLVIDATHPYASSVTGSIRRSCETCKTEYLRVLRASSDIPGTAVCVPDAGEAAKYLDKTQGSILFTTGSKELSVYSSMSMFSQRAYARVLPAASSIEACAQAGLSPSHIIAMQGPFSQEMNEALLDSTGAKWLVTKETSDEGGFAAKVNACLKKGVNLMVIGRPQDTDGIDHVQAVRLLCDRFGCVSRPHINIVGIGPGSMEMMTGQAAGAICGADCLTGAKRMIKAALDNTGASGKKPVFESISPEETARFIERNPQYQNITVLMSGDTGFFSGTKKLLAALKGADIEVIPGISTLSYLCSRLNMSYEDIYVTSLHGRDANICSLVRRHKKVLALTGGSNDAASICAKLEDYGFGYTRVSIGQRLSYPDEKIICGKAEDMINREFDPLCAMIIENEKADNAFTPGIPDEMFDRDNGEGPTVPMTKAEVRSICMSQLNIKPDSVCWDVGAGTGSVSVEMALAAYEGTVYAIEKRRDALSLLERNCRRFGIDNIVAEQGTAPSALELLPAPTHVFIGGSCGSIREILQTVYEKNSEAVIAATAVTLEAAADLTGCIGKFPEKQVRVTQVSISKGTAAGKYHIMKAANPVYIYLIKPKEQID